MATGNRIWLPITERERVMQIDRAVRTRKTLYHSRYHSAEAFVFFADVKHAARAGQLRDKIPNALFFYDIFTPEVIRDTCMSKCLEEDGCPMSRLATFMFAAVAKGTVYVVLDSRADVVQPLKRFGMGRNDFWNHVQAGVLTSACSKIRQMVRVDADNFALRGTVWKRGQKRWDVPEDAFSYNVMPGVALFDGYVGDIERPLCAPDHCWPQSGSSTDMILHQEANLAAQTQGVLHRQTRSLQKGPLSRDKEAYKDGNLCS
ncbi:uncharacterized protein PV09_09108 [Verruconis gallopava]|uniref:Uncharacterized protein n=1 Tax=Verruconis gallopava TaxID=253628 RepID=A0A0D1ZXH1_9PEZI|nr:uncharacterized protein PV09_09108 [Verruconis gallopava]KIV99152.1 hypothetical protein PV09_09108 [Verruconis gallopava]